MQNSLRRSRPLLGTFVEIGIAHSSASAPSNAAEAACDAAFGTIAEVHRLMSFHEADSDVSRLNREAGTRPVVMHPWTYQVLEAALELQHRSSNAFDIAVAPVLQEIGLLPTFTIAGTSVPAPRRNTAAFEPAAFEPAAFELLGDNRVRFLIPGTRIDLGGIAKGFAVDQAIATLQRNGIEGGIVNAGGDLAVFGPRAQRVHIRNPNDPNGPMCEVQLFNGALASSGPRHDPFAPADAPRSAIIDPRARAAVQTVVGASVKARHCLFADALTKVVMIAGEAAAPVLEAYDASALMVMRSGDVLVTPTWPRSQTRPGPPTWPGAGLAA